MRNLARLACLAPVVAVLMAGCSASPSSSPTTASASSSTASGAPAPAGTAGSPAPAGTASTGTQLKAALITDLPAGFKLNGPGTTDTGTNMQDEANGPMKGSSHCADLGATSWIQASGMSGVSFAQSDHLDGRNQEIAQEVDAFDSPDHAARAFSQLTAFMKKCKTFQDPSSTSTTYHLAVLSVHDLGARAIKGVITSSSIEGGVVEVAAVSGNNVITVLYSATTMATANHATDIATKIQRNLST